MRRTLTESCVCIALHDVTHTVVRFRRAVVEKRLSAVFPHAAVAERRCMARDSYVHLALTLLWFLRLPALDHHRVHVTDATLIDVDNSAFAQFQAEVFVAKSSAIIMTGHVGE